MIDAEEPTQPGEKITCASETLIRRDGRRSSGPYFFSQEFQRFVAHPKAFEPRLPEIRKNLRVVDRYLSTNRASTLRKAGLPLDWRCNQERYYAFTLLVDACRALDLECTEEPIFDEDPEVANEHHAAIWGVVEAYRSELLRYEKILSALSNASVVLPSSLTDKDKAQVQEAQSWSS